MTRLTRIARIAIGVVPFGRLAPSWLACTCAILPFAAHASEDELHSGRVIAVENRPYPLAHEFTASIGVSPADALYTGVTLGGSYTLHLSDIWAWEAVGFLYSANIDTGLHETLATRWSIEPTVEPELEYMLTSHVAVTPLVGKLGLFNRSILHASLHLAAGAGISHWSDGFRPVGSAGPGLRLSFGRVVSTRLDLRAVVVPDQPSGVDFLFLGTLSVSFNFGSTPPPETTERRTADGSTPLDVLDALYPTSKPERAKGDDAGATK